MIEIWKDIEGYEGLYKVSNMGRIKSLGHTDKLGRYYEGRIMKQQKHYKNGYLSVCLAKDKKQKRMNVQRLVAHHFIPNPDNKPEVNHIDENKENNIYTNLEWCTRKENNIHGTKIERFKQKRRSIGWGFKKVYCIELDKEYPSIAQAQRELKIWGISENCNGKSKYAGRHPETNEPLHWKFI